ncbi:hypothetical protein D9M68_939260 [compost metagenome]
MALVSEYALMTTASRWSYCHRISASAVAMHHLVFGLPSTEDEISSLGDQLPSPPWPLGELTKGPASSLVPAPSRRISAIWKCHCVVSWRKSKR